MTTYILLINIILPALLAGVIVIALTCYACILRLVIATISDVVAQGGAQ